MQRIKLCPLTVLIMLIITATCSAQNIFWLSGSWYGKAYLPGSDASQSYDITLKVYVIKGNKFEGVIKIIEPSDTSVHFDSKISGIVYDKYLIIKRDRILYLKNAPGIEWKVSCNNCKPPHMIFSIEKGKFFFRGEVKDCYKECNGITEFSKDTTEFDSSAKESVYALISGEQKPKVITTSIAENNHPLNDTIVSSALQVDSSVAQRIALLPAGTITLTEHNSASYLSKKFAGSLQKTPSIIIKEAESKRIPVLTAGTIVVARHNAAFTLPQKQFYSLSHAAPSILIMKETVQKRIVVLQAGNIVSVKRAASLPIYKKVSHTLQRTTTSIVVRVGNQPLAKAQLPSSTDTVSLTARNSSELTNKVMPVHHDTSSALPAGYAERKKNVIKTLLVNTDSVVLSVYDNGVVDGDIVSVIYNDKVVIDKLSLASRAFVVKIQVNKSGTNTIVFHAHNLGEFPPNTAKLEILYGNKKEELTVSSDLTVSSTIDIEYHK
jgi:hypothetical protein